MFAGASEEDETEYVAKHRYVDGGATKPIDATSLYHRELLTRSYKELGIKKVVTFHHSIDAAQKFSLLMADELRAFAPNARIYAGHVRGSMPMWQRKEVIRQFEDAELGVLTNVRCLSEGVDIPEIDAVFFAAPKESLIDIVQAVGRSMRQPYKHTGKLAKIIIPVLTSQDDTLWTGEEFVELFNVIQAMRDQDEELAEWINDVNYSAVSGHGGGSKGKGKVTLLLPETFDREAFEKALFLQIADVNREPVGTTGIGSTLGKAERKSSFTRSFATIADYNYDTLQSSLITPTLDRLPDTGAVSRSRLAINNNNVSHAERLGVIKPSDGARMFEPTPLGLQLKAGDIEFIELMRNQMLLYSRPVKGTDERIWPYRAAFQFLEELETLTPIEFTYGLYSLQAGNESELIEITRKIREEFPGVQLTNRDNQERVLKKLNELHPQGFKSNEVWTDRFTPANQFRYLGNHLALFDDLFAFDLKERKISLIGGRPPGYLERTADLLNPEEYGTTWWR